MAYKTSNKGFIGDILQSVGGTLGQIGGQALGGLIGQPGLGGQIGGAIGSAIPFSRLPFQKGGIVMMPMKKKKTKKAKGMVKGSKEAKLKMRRVRAMKK